ncbi:MAG TPA: hypothetical protein VFN61_05145 [Acidimicrobiales bacterium]|nr:hypothetical protein [Acidimicrobiales bacterium]
MLNFGGAIYAGHTTGSIRVGHAAESGNISISLKNVSPGMPAGTAVIAGHFTCTSYTSV